MNKHKHTKGPWVIEETEDTRFILASNTHAQIVEVPKRLGVSAEYNARLIAAAPMMLDRLQTILELVDSGGLGAGINANAKALVEQYLVDAIAKATGESHE